MRSSADFRMELPSVGVVLVGTDTMADRGDSWTGDQREAGTSRWPPVGTWVWPPVDTFSWPGTPSGSRLQAGERPQRRAVRVIQLLRQQLNEDLSEGDSSRLFRLVEAPPLDDGQP